ncbi:MAG: HlyD family efflux transporter periplasmic adaptor subunit [Opitutales bacterium]|nr:HlyD family efflux transporter periplasmic adaptor subunit [Opitutales bacterium]
MNTTILHSINKFCTALLITVFSCQFSHGSSPNIDANSSKALKNYPPENKKLEIKEKLPASIRPKLKHFKIQLTLDGFIEDTEAIPLSVNSSHWNELKVIQPPVHGKSIVKGEVLMKLDDQKIKRQVELLSYDLSMLDADRNILKVEIELAEKLLPLHLNEIKTDEKYGREDLKRFQTITLPFEKKSVEMNLKRYQDHLLYSQEELNQLKQMYQEDDLTEETEEIILQRAKNDIQYMHFYVESAKKQVEEFNQIRRPRSVETLRGAIEQQNLHFQAQQKTNPAKIKIQRLQLSRLNKEREIIIEKKTNLTNDLKHMIMKSPAKGTLYWGTFVRGKWSGPEPFHNKLQKGGNLKAHEPVLTLCPGKKTRACINIPEKHLTSFEKVKEGRIVFISDPQRKYTAEVSRISTTSDSAGSYTGYLNFSLPHNASQPNAGSSCTFSFTAYEKKNALLLPSNVIFSEDHDSEIQYVFVLTKSGKTIKRIVETGRKTDKVTEITKGISKREKVLKEKPDS